EDDTSYAPPDRRPSHRNRLLQMFADAAARAPATAHADPDPLVPLAYSFAAGVYPQLVADDINRVPPWLTLWSPFPWYRRRSPAARRLLSSRKLWLATLLLPGIGWLVYLIILALSSRGRRVQAWRKRLAAVLSLRYGFAPGGLAELLEDDDPFSLLLQRFL